MSGYVSCAGGLRSACRVLVSARDLKQKEGVFSRCRDDPERSMTPSLRSELNRLPERARMLLLSWIRGAVSPH